MVQNTVGPTTAKNRGAPINREPVAFPTTATQLIRQRQSSSASVIARLQFLRCGSSISV